MLVRCLLTGVVALLLAPAGAGAAENEAEKVLDRFVGAWRNDISRLGPEAPERRKLTSNEVIAKELKGRFLIGREMNPESGVKVMWFMTYDPQSKSYVWTYFNTRGLLGTEWKGTWDEAAATLTSKSSQSPAMWSSESVNRFVDQDTVEANAWLKDDQGKLIFETSLKKTRQPTDASEKMLAAWTTDWTPAAELPSELKVLDRLAGTWDVTSHAKQAEWTPMEERVTSKVVRTWVLNRTYLQDTSVQNTTLEGTLTGDDGKQSLSLFTYDPQRAAYRSWWFSSDGYTSKSTGQWDAASNTLRTTSTLPAGQTSVGSVRFTDDDHHEWKILITDDAGKVYFDCIWDCVRAKP
jgi:hypothetical protein